MLTHKRSTPAAAVHRRSAALFLLADVLAAALLVFGNYFFLYVAPIQGLGGASMPLPQVQNNIQQSSQQQITEVTGSAPEQTRPVSLREKFAEHFTDTVVSSDTAYSSPNLSVEVTQHTLRQFPYTELRTYSWMVTILHGPKHSWLPATLPVALR